MGRAGSAPRLCCAHGDTSGGARRRRSLTALIAPFSVSFLSLLPCFAWAVSVADSHQAACGAVQETTSLFALLLWRARMTRHLHAASHVPSDTAGEHGTSTPVLVRPRGHAPTSESGVREHTPHSRCSFRTTRTRTKIKHTQMTTKAAFLVAFG